MFRHANFTVKPAPTAAIAHPGHEGAISHLSEDHGRSFMMPVVFPGSDATPRVQTCGGHEHATQGSGGTLEIHEVLDNGLRSGVKETRRNAGR